LDEWVARGWQYGGRGRGVAAGWRENKR
jgi:hypothetical protein